MVKSGTVKYGSIRIAPAVARKPEPEVRNINVPSNTADEYNKFIFGEAFSPGIPVSELLEEIEVRGLTPNVYSEKAFLSWMLAISKATVTATSTSKGSAKKSAKKQAYKLTVKDAKEILAKLLHAKVLLKKDDLILTKLLRDYVDKARRGESPLLTWTIHRLNTESASDETEEDSIQIECPHCRDGVALSDKLGRSLIKCRACSKVFMTLTGKLKRREGSFTRTASFGPPPFVLRFDIGDKEESLSFRTRNQFDANAGDKLTVIFTQSEGLFSKKLSISSILNWNTRNNWGVSAILD